MRKLFCGLLAVLAIPSIAVASTCTDNLMGTGMPGLQAETLCTSTPDTITSAGAVTVTAGDLTMTAGTLIQQEKIKVAASSGKAGATATVGYVNTGVDVDKVTLAASATADTWVIPITGLNVGDTVTAFSIHGQIESAGNTATVDADLRKHTAVATGSTDASVGAITQISKTADYLIDDSKTALTETLDANEFLYVLVTSTTAASTDVELLGIELTVTRGNE